MKINFNSDEVFEIAEQMERNGAKFYKKAAEISIDANNNKLFSKLSSMEVAHEQVFASMREKITNSKNDLAVYDPDGEAASYLRAWADGKVFNDMNNPVEEIVGRNPGVKDILKAAIGLENDSILYYLGIKEMTSDKDSKEQIDRIIKEEIMHVAFLNKELERMN